MREKFSLEIQRAITNNKKTSRIIHITTKVSKNYYN